MEIKVRVETRIDDLDYNGRWIFQCENARVGLVCS